MHMKELSKWNTRMSAVYALGVWTMIGSYAYFRYSGRYADETPKTDEEMQEAVDPNQVVYKTAHSKTTIIYKKDFVPWGERISNFFQWFTGGPKPGAGDADK